MRLLQRPRAVPRRERDGPLGTERRLWRGVGQAQGEDPLRTVLRAVDTRIRSRLASLQILVP